MTSPLSEKSWVRYAVVLTVAVLMLALGLNSFGIWQLEAHVADQAREPSGAMSTPGPAGSPVTLGRLAAASAAAHVEQGPPLRVGFVRWGFAHVSSSESGGRLPTALLAILATLALAYAVGSATDSRTGAFVGIAYASMPLVFMNARQMFGGGVAQSGYTLFFASLLYLFWGRAPTMVALRWFAVPALTYGLWVAVGGGGVMLTLAPVLMGISIAVLVRWRDEKPVARYIALGLFGVGAVLALQGILASIGGESATLTWWRGALGVESLCPHRAPADAVYCSLTGALTDAHGPAQLPTYDALMEHIGHGLFPWTGFVAFGLTRLLAPPPRANVALGPTAEPVSDDDAYREQAVRLAALAVAVLSYGLQSFHLQQFGASPYLAVAPLAMAGGMLLRDAEREALPWRVVTAGTTFFTVIMMRDFLLFPKSSYAALGLTDGGPAFPTGFTSKIGDWARAQGSHVLGAFFTGNAPGEVYFLVEALLFIVLALAALYQGAGMAKPFALSRPFSWLAELEHDSHVELDLTLEEAPPPALRDTMGLWLSMVTGRLNDRQGRPVSRFKLFSSAGFLGAARVYVIVWTVASVALLGLTMAISRGLSTPLRIFLLSVGGLPFGVLAGVYAVILLWNIHAWLGNPGKPVTRLLGSRMGVVLASTVLVSLVISQLFVPALSEHFSPRGVWAVIRQLRHGDEPVARFGGNQNDQSARYYAATDVRDIFAESDAVDWLRQREPRHFLIVGADVFPSLNRAFRLAGPLGNRLNVPVIDANNSNLYVAASTATGTGSRNPFDSVVMSTDRLTNGRPSLEALATGAANNDHWHPHGRWEGTRFIPEAARFNEAIEYLGYNLDSGGQSFVPIGGSFRIKYHFRVLQELPGAWQVFVHTDGQCPRINGDHEPGGGRYPVRYWLPGDIVHDEQTITINPYCRAGTYYVYIGFFQGDDRMRVTGGDHDRENRVIAARVVVR